MASRRSSGDRGVSGLSSARRGGRETDPAALRAALSRRVGRRSALSAKLTLPAVPSMLESYVASLSAVMAGLGRPLSAERTAELREQLASAVEASWRVSPHGNIVIRIDADASGHGSFSANVVAAPTSLQAQYDTWTETREPPFFGTFPDARVVDAASSLGDPAAAPVLDVGAGTGRNALALAREGFPVDAVEPTAAFALALRAGAADEDLPLTVIEADLFSPDLRLEGRHALVVLSEVTSHFRSPAELRRALERSAQALRPGGLLLFNVFLSVDGYTPDARARELSQAFWSTLFTAPELAQATAGLPLELLSRDRVADYERAGLPEDAWPPTPWYPEWVSGQDVFDLPDGRAPVDFWWLCYRRTGDLLRLDASPVVPRRPEMASRRRSGKRASSPGDATPWNRPDGAEPQPCTSSP